MEHQIADTKFLHHPRTQRGMATVEFALMLPVLLLLMFGTFFVFDSVRAERQMSLAVSTVTDLSTRVEEMTDEKRDAIYLAAQAVMGSYANNGASTIKIASIVNELGDGNDDYTLDWSVASDNVDPIDENDLSNMSLPVIPDGESLILSQIQLEYYPVFKLPTNRGVFVLQDSEVRRPRFVTQVEYESVGPSTLPADESGGNNGNSGSGNNGNGNGNN